MCSSPKSSTKYRRSARKTEFNREQYQQYARMMRHASACYEKAQQRKAERQKQTAKQQSLDIDKTSHATKSTQINQPGIFLIIKAFLTAPVVLP